MKRKPFLIILAVLLACTLFSAGCGKSGANHFPAADPNSTPVLTLTPAPSEAPAPTTVPTPSHYDDYYEEPIGCDIPLSELPRDSFNRDAYDALLTEFETYLQMPGKEEDLCLLFDEILLSFDLFASELSLTQLDYYNDPTNEALSDHLLDINETSIELQDRTYTLFSSIFDTSYKATFEEYLGPELSESLKEYAPLSEEGFTLLSRIDDLVLEYTMKTADDYDGFSSAKERTAALKELYVDLVNLRNEFAILQGYDNFAVYAYEAEYSRDYTPEDTAELVDAALTNLYPVFLRYTNDRLLNGTLEHAFDYYDEPVQTIYQTVVPFMRKIHPSLGDAMDHLFQNKLQDMDTSPTKAPVSYTSSLPYYMDAYIFSSPYEMNLDITTLIHEFGHYNHYYHVYYPALFTDTNLDVAEIHSQGLEALFCDYYPELNPEYGSSLKEYTLYSLMNSVFNASAVNAVEYAAYTTPNLTPQKLDEIVASVNSQYADLSMSSADFADISHVFEVPFYYISYATSALGALEIYDLAQTDRDAAVDCYLKLSASSLYLPLQQVLEENGLPNYLDTQNLKTLCTSLAAHLTAGDGSLPSF